MLSAHVPWLFLPLRTPQGPIGVLGVAQSEDAPLNSESRTLFETVTELTATALERARLGNEISAARTAAEAERVRNTLLASISHDFRTPLASILGAATSLIEYGARLPEPARNDLLTQVKDEAEHLDGMVRNLL
jgi:two-component system sensor histidine kinase KdpD